MKKRILLHINVNSLTYHEESKKKLIKIGDKIKIQNFGCCPHMFDAKDSIIYFSVFRSPDQNVHVRYCYHFSCQYKLNSFALSSKQARKKFQVNRD
jgi:hypothetical protein